jgi:hypothetical protein
MAGARFGEELLKATEGLGPPCFPSFEEVWIRPQSTLTKHYRSIYLS